ncbi:MAG: bifunctional aldolase/short-chain dehydrogenase [Candidatus Omnitrophica bacterium]|nr:bifunctional aldolase/short-chain dehydrogenase [Candidatus Omnitrophota bacterium]
MRSLWKDKEARRCGQDHLKLRVYTSRLLGREPSLVLHRGGNTSLKTTLKDFFGQSQEVLYIKGSGWDLATIPAEGFAAVKLDALKRMAALPKLSDSDMVLGQRAAMLNPNAPNPSVEAILHAIIPYSFVDHSHADAVVAMTNTPKGPWYMKEIYGPRVLIVPYVMPGFVLARQVYEMTRGLNWGKCDGIVLLNHGLFTFGDDAKASYENHIRLVTRVENFIRRAKIKIAKGRLLSENLLDLARLRQAVSKVGGAAVVACLKNDSASLGFANIAHVNFIATRGPLTPDHVLRTKPVPVVIRQEPAHDVLTYAKNYKSYFDRHNDGNLKCMDLAPRWAVWPLQGLVTFGRSYKDAQIVSDIVDHTIVAIQWAEKLGGWKVLSEKDIFEVEYWELEQAKLSKNPKPLALQGKIALVTGAASGIGKACVECLAAQGAHVAGLDIKHLSFPNVRPSGETSPKRVSNILGIVADVTKDSDLQKAVETTVRHFGGLDIVVSNAGIFPPSETLSDMNPNTWDRSVKINLTSHQRLMKAAIPYLAHGIDPTFIMIGSKNVPAPGVGAGAYSVAKAGLTQLARVAALELASKGIRVNVLHPNQVFDTAIWTKEVLEKRAQHYGLSVDEYRKSNLLKTEITSKNVADLVGALAGPVFAKTTGAQIPIDGGNERVI